MILDFKMLMPFDSGRPVAPLNYIQWLFNANGVENILIRFIDYQNIKFEEYDAYFYIRYKDQQIIRYCIESEDTYVWLDGGTKVKSVEELTNFLDKINCKTILEQPHKCTYGI